MVTLYRTPDAHTELRQAQRARVSVNGVVIASDAIARETQQHPADQPLDAWRAAARALAVRELMLQQARRKCPMAAPIADGEGRRETGDEALIRSLIEQEVATPEPDHATCRRYYEANRQRFRSADIYQASHILLPARPQDADALAKAREDAAGLMARLADKPDAFNRLAETHSACSSAKLGGSLGQVMAGDTTPAFEAELKRLQPGEISRAPVETPYGLHIVWLERRISGEVLPFEAVRARIAGYLKERSERLAVAQYLARLASEAKVEGIDLPCAADLRVY